MAPAFRRSAGITYDNNSLAGAFVNQNVSYGKCSWTFTKDSDPYHPSARKK